MNDESPYERFVRETGINISRATFYRMRAEVLDDRDGSRLAKIVDAEKKGLYDQSEVDRRKRKMRKDREYQGVPF